MISPGLKMQKSQTVSVDGYDGFHALDGRFHLLFDAISDEVSHL